MTIDTYAVRISRLDRRLAQVAYVPAGGAGGRPLVVFLHGRGTHPGGFSTQAASAALWSAAGDTPAGAFDDADDFSSHDVIGWARDGARGLKVPVWLDTGSDDPFRASNKTLADALRADGADVTTNTWPGGHNRTYWKQHFGQYVAFYARTLKAC